MPEATGATKRPGATRRVVLATAVGLTLAPRSLAAVTPPQAWLDYERRLRARAADAGGGRFEIELSRELLDLTNRARSAAGAAGLSWSEPLALTARAHAADLAARVYVEHISPEGFDPTHRSALLARRLIGSPSENIGYRRHDQPSRAADFIALWRASSPHWRNLLRPTHAVAGYGVVRLGQRFYAVGLYARPAGELSEPLPLAVRDEAEISPRVEAPLQVRGFVLTDPLDERFADAFRNGESPRRLAPGAYQLRPQRPAGDRLLESLWGPIFVRL